MLRMVRLRWTPRCQGARPDSGRVPHHAQAHRDVVREETWSTLTGDTRPVPLHAWSDHGCPVGSPVHSHRLSDVGLRMLEAATAHHATHGTLRGATGHLADWLSNQRDQYAAGSRSRAFATPPRSRPRLAPAPPRTSATAKEAVQHRRLRPASPEPRIVLPTLLALVPPEAQAESDCEPVRLALTPIRAHQILFRKVRTAVCDVVHGALPREPARVLRALGGPVDLPATSEQQDTGARSVGSTPGTIRNWSRPCLPSIAREQGSQIQKYPVALHAQHDALDNWAPSVP